MILVREAFCACTLTDSRFFFFKIFLFSWPLSISFFQSLFTFGLLCPINFFSVLNPLAKFRYSFSQKKKFRYSFFFSFSGMNPVPVVLINREIATPSSTTLCTVRLYSHTVASSTSRVIKPHGYTPPEQCIHVGACYDRRDIDLDASHLARRMMLVVE